MFQFSLDWLVISPQRHLQPRLRLDRVRGLMLLPEPFVGPAQRAMPLIRLTETVKMQPITWQISYTGKLPSIQKLPVAVGLFFIGTEFSNLHYLVRQRSRRPDQRVLHFGGHPLRPKVPSVPAEVLELPQKALADELVQAYFVHVNRGLPIIDEDDFMKVYNGPRGHWSFPNM